MLMSSYLVLRQIGNSNDTFKETADVNPVNPYARSKLMLEKIIQDMPNSQSGLKSVF